MSQDKLVTPVTLSTSPDPVWIQRQLSLSAIRTLRMQNIERMFGGIRRLGDRCGCQKNSRFSGPQEGTRVWCALVTAERRGVVRQSSLCRIHKQGWIVWQPEAIGFAWAEILEVSNIDSLLAEGSLSLAGESLTMGQWEELGRGEFKFRLFSEEDCGQEEISQQMRISLADDILKRNPGFSHVNLMVESSPFWHVGASMQSLLKSRKLEMEELRPRLLPNWQSGDMDIRTFTTYTLRRKDIRGLSSEQSNG